MSEKASIPEELVALLMEARAMLRRRSRHGSGWWNDAEIFDFDQRAGLLLGRMERQQDYGPKGQQQDQPPSRVG